MRNVVTVVSAMQVNVLALPIRGESRDVSGTGQHDQCGLFPADGPQNLHSLDVPGDERLAEYCGLLETVERLGISRYDYYSQSIVELTAFAGGVLPENGKYKGYMFFPVDYRIASYSM